MRNFMLSGAQIAYAPDDGAAAAAAAAAAAPGGAAEQAAAAAAAAAAASKPWYDGADPAVIGHIQTKGWHEKTPAEAALLAVAAHREAEKFIGHPADQVLKLPKDAADAEGWKAVWGKLGVPADAAGYDFTGLKFADGTEPTDAFKDFVRTTSHALNVPAAQATQLAASLIKYLEDGSTADAAENTAKLAEQQKALDADWGANKEANLFIAKQAAAKLGITPEAIQALEGQVGYAAVMQAMLKVGKSIGEDRFVNGGVNKDGILSREQAVARKQELMADTAWAKRYLDGGHVEAREMTALNTLIVGDDS